MQDLLVRVKCVDFKVNSEQFIYWGLIALLTGFYWSPHYKIQAYVFHVTMFIPFLVFHWRKLFWPWYSNIHIIALIYILYSGLSSFWTVGEPIRPLFRGCFYIIFLWVYLTIINWFFYEGSKGKNFKLFMQIMCFGGAAIGIFSAFVFYGRHPFSERLEPFFSNENLILFARCLGLSGIMGLLLYKNNKNCFWLICALLCCFIMLLSQTRGVMIGIILSLICFLFFSDIKNKIIIGLSILIMLIIITQINTFHRMLNAQSERWQIYGRIFENITGHEVFGMGLMTDTDIATGDFGYPHSLFLTSFYTGGVVGLGLLLTLIMFSLREAFKIARKKGELTGLVLIMNGIGIYLFDGGHLVSHPHHEWLFFWLPIFLVASQKFHEDQIMAPSFE